MEDNRRNRKTADMLKNYLKEDGYKVLFHQWQKCPDNSKSYEDYLCHSEHTPVCYGHLIDKEGREIHNRFGLGKYRNMPSAYRKLYDEALRGNTDYAIIENGCCGYICCGIRVNSNGEEIICENIVEYPNLHGKTSKDVITSLVQFLESNGYKIIFHRNIHAADNNCCQPHCPGHIFKDNEIIDVNLREILGPYDLETIIEDIDDKYIVTTDSCCCSGILDDGTCPCASEF